MTERTFLDLFCGAGGLSLGFSSAGWRCVGAIDHWNDALSTYRLNFPMHRALPLDIADAEPREIRARVPERPDFVIGGPPCQGFSTVGKRIRRDPRNRLVEAFYRFVKVLEPSGFVIENVPGLRDMAFVDEICDLFGSLSYKVSALMLASADFGVPQLRRRIFFVGHRSAGYFQGPISTHRTASYVSVWDAIGDLPPLLPGEAKAEYERPPLAQYQRALRKGSKSLQGHRASAHPIELVRAISYIPDGGNRRSIPPRLQPSSGYHNSYSRLHSKSPAVAVTQNMGKPSGTRCIHPTQDRGLTAREGARLQGFPDRFHFVGGMISQRLQIANAVSPILAEKVATALQDSNRWSYDAAPDALAETPTPLEVATDQ